MNKWSKQKVRRYTLIRLLYQSAVRREADFHVDSQSYCLRADSAHIVCTVQVEYLVDFSRRPVVECTRSTRSDPPLALPFLGLSRPVVSLVVEAASIVEVAADTVHLRLWY